MGTLDRFSLKGKTALVTGASYGLGVGFARALAEAGANIVLAARSAGKLENVAADVEKYGVKTLACECDVTDPATVAATVAQAWDRFGRVDVLVNNAGVIAEAGIMPERTVDDLFQKTIATNVNGLFTCCREVGSRQLADGRGGSIINITSATGIGGLLQFPSAYQASKAAVINLTKNLGASWARRGVRVNALAPGWFESEMTAPFFGLPEFAERVHAMTPMGRHGRAEELDCALLFLASDASSFVTGSTLVVDGGMSATVGGVDYDEDTFAVMRDLFGEAGTPIQPAGE